MDQPAGSESRSIASWNCETSTPLTTTFVALPSRTTGTTTATSEVPAKGPWKTSPIRGWPVRSAASAPGCPRCCTRSGKLTPKGCRVLKIIRPCASANATCAPKLCWKARAWWYSSGQRRSSSSSGERARMFSAFRRASRKRSMSVAKLRALLRASLRSCASTVLAWFQACQAASSTSGVMHSQNSRARTLDSARVFVTGRAADSARRQTRCHRGPGGRRRAPAH